MKALDFLRDFVKRDPLAVARPLEWQRVALTLYGGGEWEASWGPPPSEPAQEIHLIAANQCGKSTLLGLALASHVQGRLPRFPMPGELWHGAPSLAKSSSVARVDVGALLRPDEITAWPNRHNDQGESRLRTAAGWRLAFKSFGQDAGEWASARLQAVALDEPAPDPILNEARIRLTRHAGVLLTGQTPLEGIDSDLYRTAWEPLQARLEELREQARRRAPWRVRPCRICGVEEVGPCWAEVRPGAWIFTLGMRDNARSVGGFLPDSAVDARERELLEAGREREAAVRIHGEWLDVAEDSIIPVDCFGRWETLPTITDKACWIDSAFSARQTADRFAIAVAGLAEDGKRYLIDLDFGRFEAGERVSRSLAMLERHGFPPCYVQRTTPDSEFAVRVNEALMLSGRLASVRLHPERGAVPGKVERAHAFATAVAAGQILIGKGPRFEEFLREARVFPVGPHDDVLDAGMGALMVLRDESRGREAYREAVAAGDRPPPPLAWTDAPDMGSLRRADATVEHSDDWEDDDDDWGSLRSFLGPD